MANYGVLYVFRFESANKTNIEIQVLKKDYSGARTYRSLGRAPILKREKSGAVHGSSLELYAECQVDGEFASLYTSSADEYKVEVYKIDEFLGDTIMRRVWTGFVSPELYSEPDIAPPYDVQIIATDGLGELKNYAFEARGLHSVQDHLEYMLEHTGLNQDLDVISFMAGNSGTVPIMDVVVSLDHMAGESCYDVLKAVLDSFHAEIACQDGYWMIWRETDLVNLASQVEVAEFGSQAKADWWPVGQLSTVIEPAKKRVTVISENAYKDNVLKDVPFHADGATYDSEEKAFVLSTAGASVLKRLSFGTEVGYKLSLSVTARSVGSGDAGQPIGIKVKIEGRGYIAGDTFWLREKTDGKTAWSNAEGTVEKTLDAPSASDSAADAQTIVLELPLYYYSGRAYQYAESIEVTVVNMDGSYPVNVYDVTLSKAEQIKGYRSGVEIDNGAREEADEATLIIADDDRIPAAADLFMDGIAMNADGALISSWASGRLAAMGYLAFMSRDYALSVALPRMKVQGVLNVPESALITPVLFIRDNTYYFPETYNYDLLNDELSVNLVSIPTAEIDVVSEEVTEVVDPFPSRPSSGSSSGGSSSGGGTSGGGSADIEGSEFIDIKGGKVTLVVDPQGGLGATEQGLGIIDIPESALGNVPNKTYVDDAARQAYNNAYNDSVNASTAYTDTAKQQLIASKAGAFYVEPSTNLFIVFTTEEKKAAYIANGDASGVLGKFALGGGGASETLYDMQVIIPEPLYSFTTASEKMMISAGFESKVKYAGSDSYETFSEDAVFSVDIFKGGEWKNVISQMVSHGGTFSADLKPYVANGDNTVRVTATGIISSASGVAATTVSVTTMSLAPFGFQWYTPFVEGQSYELGGLKILGTLNKRLHIKVTGNGYSREYVESIGTQQYDIAPYSFRNLVHPSATGIYKVEMWLEAVASGVKSDTLTYNIMCVAQSAVGTAKLVCLNEVATEADNYAENKLFAYAIYNGGSASGSPTITLKKGSTTIASSSLNVDAGVPHDYSYAFALAMTETSANITATATFGNTQTATITLKNETSFAPVGGYSFYMDAATRSNGEAYRNYIVNEANGSRILASWTDMAWVDGMDGWTTDQNGNKCLLLPAMSKAYVDYAPMANKNTMTLELFYKVQNAADFDEDIITIASNVASSWMGVKVKPTNVTLHSQSLYQNDLMQGYNTKDEEMVHLVITIIGNYDGIGSIAMIYVNGGKRCSFEWSTGDTFAHNGTLVLGSDTADLYIYKMRVYDSQFLWPQVLQNYISCQHTAAERSQIKRREDSVLNDSNGLDYDKIVGKQNTFVIELPKGAKLPNRLNNHSNDPIEGSNLYIDIVQDKSCTIQGEWLNVPLEGQGTTAMTYFRWNLRSKTDTIRITAKKNVASSMHSHKRGATALFNDLYQRIVGANEVNGRMAVYQYPVYGYQKVENEDAPGTYFYEFIGLYTIGPDKGDKPTFGFDNAEYKDTLIHMEGTDHSPAGVGYDYPWEQMTVGLNEKGDPFIGAKNASGGLAQKAWEIGACGGKKTASDIKTYLDAEYAPAYKLDYECTPMISGLASGQTIDSVNADVESFREQTAYENFTKADCIIFDADYNTYYYNVNLQSYVVDGRKVYDGLTSSHGFSLSTLNSKGSVSAKEQYIRDCRAKRHRAEVGNYWLLRDSLFHACFLDLIGATDNEKKNTYPLKFGTLASGSRWRHRQDDLDTMADINNQGSADKKYSIMNTDSKDGVMVYKGNSSYHWRCIREYYKDEMKAMMQEIFDNMKSLSPYGTSDIQKLVGCIRHYFWDYAQEYFTRGAYNIDAKWTYEDTWRLYKSDKTINAVHPLQQSLGSHYEAEVAWMTLRMLFLASMNEWGAFVHYSDSSEGQVSFRQGGNFTFNLTPAIDMRPSVVVGQDTDKKFASGRIMAGKIASITVAASASADTMSYIQGADWLQDIGDMSKLKIASNSDGARILSVTSKRLQRLKVGDAVATNVKTNITGLDLGSCPSLAEIDARNVTDLAGEVDLTNCPRLRTARFGGTSASVIILPDGSKIETFNLPSSLMRLTLRKLPLLRKSGLTYDALNNLTYLWVQDNKNLEGYALLKSALEGGSPLNNIRVVGFDVNGTTADIEFLKTLANGNYHAVDEQGNPDNASLPYLEGSVYIAGTASGKDRDFLKGKFPVLVINADGFVDFIEFADPEVLRVLLANGVGSDGGVTEQQVEAVTSIGTWFRGNTVIRHFDEFKEFINVTELGRNLASNSYAPFYNCTGLQTISFPPNLAYIRHYAFNGCTSLTNIGNLSEMSSSIKAINTSAFQNCTSLIVDKLNCPNLEELGDNALRGVRIRRIENLGKLTTMPAATGSQQNYGATDCLEYCSLPDTLSTIRGRSFQGYSVLTTLVIGTGCTAIEGYLVNNCKALTEVVVKATTPPTLDANAWAGASALASIYVPDASVDAYKAATNWSNSNITKKIKPLSEFNG